MNKKQAIKLYCDTMESFGYVRHKPGGPYPDTYEIDNPDDIADEMMRVVDAKSDRAAAKVIDWWGCWDGKWTSTRMARRIRQIHNGSYKPCLKKPQ